MIVVDTNLLAYAVLPGGPAALVRRAAEHDPDWIAPALWRLELANILATSMHVRGLAIDDAVAAFSYAEQLVSDAELVPLVEERLEIAARGSVSVYDAEFVFIAERLDLLLVTADRRLAQAFPGRARLLEDFGAAG